MTFCICTFVWTFCTHFHTLHTCILRVYIVTYTLPRSFTSTHCSGHFTHFWGHVAVRSFSFILFYIRTSLLRRYVLRRILVTHVTSHLFHLPFLIFHIFILLMRCYICCVAFTLRLLRFRYIALLHSLFTRSFLAFTHLDLHSRFCLYTHITFYVTRFHRYILHLVVLRSVAGDFTLLCLIFIHLHRYLDRFRFVTLLHCVHTAHFTHLHTLRCTHSGPHFGTFPVTSHVACIRYVTFTHFADFLIYIYILLLECVVTRCTFVIHSPFAFYGDLHFVARYVCVCSPLGLVCLRSRCRSILRCLVNLYTRLHSVCHLHTLYI